jgi:hemolysin III
MTGANAIVSEHGRPMDRGEFIADGVVHAIGLAAAVAAAATLVAATLFWRSSTAVAAIYAFGLIAMFGCSAGYNLGVRLPFREVWRRLDLAAIFVMIAGTYTPFTVTALSGAWAVGLTAVIWAIAAFGVTMKLVLAPRGSQTVTTLLYIAFGWIGLLAVRPFLEVLSPTVLWMLLAGGLVYTAGTVFFSMEKLRYQRAIWHGFVVAGAAIHFCAIFAMLSAVRAGIAV